MIRTIIWFAYFWLYLIAIEPVLMRINHLSKMGRISERDKLTSEIAKKWARSLLKCAGVTVTISGEEKIPSGPVLFVSNHQGNFDIPLLLGYINKPKAFIAKIELLKIPLIRTWMTHMQCVFMDRSDIRQSLKVINQAAINLKEGYSMVIFPEGTRSKCETLGDFKPGSLKLALKAGVPIVPLTIRGSYKIMEENGFLIKPAHVEIIISDPIPTSNLTKDQANELPDRVYAIIDHSLTQVSSTVA
ncbi:1-acyl-sn-glycerol-3-phosphate acyltransferase [Desulfosporosinus acidiphilus SJ4]|uniref:1-acyl-sn-glycerol-3-phosphate acyltransferase n=1 Tax=Desulfosporosinus acidiphilus (strain DSM 22704 / JCM 16185 / SJ4) TaxID=646529 RepID=I4D4I6_DESAJ|nr:lysophospholipid acyltransferase family protein [Desulfosporosinus acidiphilus]AFM40710.1 1-acyl-sn-glycerol-3-phosphate acyltransferase [Desulfosporosinus acidiphilus SJ4]